MNCDTHRIKIELEEDPRCSLTVLERTRVVRDTVLVRLKRATARRNICRRNNMEVVLKGGEI